MTNEINNSELKNNILLNYDVFLLEQYELLKEIKNIVEEKITSYKNNYKAYYLNDLDARNKTAYDNALEELAKIKTDLNKISEVLEIYGVLTQEIIAEDLELLELLKFQNEELKALKNKVQNTENASKPLKENYNSEYRKNFLWTLLKVVFAIMIFVIAYIQIKNRRMSVY